ncbi:MULTISPECIES: phenylacetate--CoA ligase PaaK [Mycolicibacterium]|nr:phenylacetate--CoA ligase PaaK [Mycolicibacterium chitae]MCV7104994.1 phenylacetate--CoA ligase [Mycolicibacterium chitae]
MTKYRTVDSAECINLGQLRELQLQRLRRTLHHAYTNVPFYRHKFNELGVHPDDCRSLDDLAKFPTTTKADLRDNYPFGMFAVPQDQVRRIHASSGTTGEPTVVGYTANDIETWSNLVARCITAAGGRAGHKIHIAYGYGLFTGGLGAHYGAEKLGCTVIPASGGMTARQVRIIKDFEPDIIMVTPSYMLTLLDEFDRQGLDARETSLSIGILGAEPWTEEMRSEIESRTGIDALDTYGLSEVMGPGVAQEFRDTKDGPHIWEDHFIPEVLDPATGAVLDDGVEGDLTFTSLTKEAFPVIRYRTRDLTTLLPGTACENFRRIARVAGRSDDMIVLRGVNLFPTQIEELVVRSSDLSPHFRLILSKSGRLDRLAVEVEMRGDRTAEAGVRAAAELEASIKNSIGVSAAVAIVESGSLPRSDGKINRVVDQRR